MSFTIEFSEDAERHLSRFSARDRSILLDDIEEQLTHQPNVETRRRTLMQENPLARWKLRVRKYRVFYNISYEQTLVIVVAIGVKERNTLLIEDRRYPL